MNVITTGEVMPMVVHLRSYTDLDERRSLSVNTELRPFFIFFVRNPHPPIDKSYSQGYSVYEHMLIYLIWGGDHSMDKNVHTYLTPDTLEKVSTIFKALSDPTRIKILYLLSEEECSVTHMSEVLNLSQSAVSHQLSLLRNLRLVKFRREANTMYYSCDDDHVISLLTQAIQHAKCD